MSQKNLWWPIGCLLCCLLFNTSEGDKKIEEEIEIIEEIYMDGGFRKWMSTLAETIVKDKKFQEEFKKFLAIVGKPEVELDFGDADKSLEMAKWHPRPNGAPKSPKTKKRLKTFKEMFKEPKFQEVAKQFALHLLNRLEFQRAFRKVLPEMKVKIEDKRPKKPKSKPKRLTEASVAYSDEE